MTETVEVEEVPPEEVFSLLGHDLRISIIQALWEAGNDPVPFSNLRDRADVADSGQFNYHLGELVGTFVQHTEDGYELTYAGQRVVGAILDGTYTKHASIPPFDTEASCPDCGTPLEAQYADEFFSIRCPTCEDLLQGLPFPPGGLDGRTREELVETAAHWLHAEFVLMRNGICPNCAGIMARTLDADLGPRTAEVGVRYDCQRCMWEGTSTVVSYFLSHPAVVAFYHDHGIDPIEEWMDEFRRDHSIEVRSEEPLSLTVTIPLDGDELELVVDGDLEVVESRRT